MKTNPERTAAIQAGGNSQRMGRDKGLVQLAGLPLVERVLARLEGLTDQVIITTNAPDSYRYLGLPLAEDQRPRAGALEGLRTALANAGGDRVLVVGCDMPFLEPKLLGYMLALEVDAQVIIPHWAGRLQPLCAVYHRTCLPAVEAALAAGEKRLISFHGQVDIHILDRAQVASFDPDGLSFFNVNTPQDLITAEAILASGAADKG